MIDEMNGDGAKNSHAIIGGFDDYKVGIAYTARNNNLYAGFFKHGKNFFLIRK